MLPTGDPLGTVVTMLATPCGRLDGLAIDTAGAGGWRPTGSPPDSTSEGVIDGLPGSVSFPRRKVVVGPPWGKIVGQRSPDTAIAVAVEDGINHGPHLGLAWPPTGAGRRQEGLQDSPLLACQITGVWLRVHTLSTFETPLLEQTLRMTESFASYLAKNYVATKGFKPGTVPEAQKLKSASDIILTRADGLAFSIICIVDAEADPSKRFTLSAGEVETIGQQCTKYSGRVRGRRIPVEIRIFQVGSLPINAKRRENMRSYKEEYPTLASVLINATYIDTTNKVVYMNTLFNGLTRGRLFIERLLKTPRESDASLQKTIAVQSAVGQKIIPWLTYFLLAVFLVVFGAEQYFAISPPIGFLSPSVRTLIALGALHSGPLFSPMNTFVSCQRSFCIRPYSFSFKRPLHVFGRRYS